MTTPKLQMPELVVGQAGKELTHNQALAVLDQLAQAVVVDKDLTAPPGSPANGSMYIVAAGATGAWSGQSGKLAYWLTTVAAWTFITPADGWVAWVADEAKRYERVGGAWVLSTAALGLGTASTANVTISAIDTTAGRVMKVGDAGILGPTPGYSDGNALPNGQGFYCWYMEGASSTNLPLPAVENWQGFESGGANINRGFVIAAGLTTGKLVWRTRSASVNGPWQTAWSNLSENRITVDTGSFGYGTGSGGAVTQATSKATGVTLNKPSGQITTNSAALAANTAVSFTLTNDKIATNDIPKVVIKSGATAGAYVVQVDAVAAGSCRISIRNMTAGSLSETLVLQFNNEKGATA